MKQEVFDFSRADRAAILDNAIIAGNGKVSGKLMKTILRRIDYRAGLDGDCWESQASIATAIGYSTRRVKAAIAELEQLSLITTERRTCRFGTRTNHHRIVWNELALLTSSKAKTHESSPSTSGGISTDPRGQFAQAKGTVWQRQGTVCTAAGDRLSPKSYEYEEAPRTTRERSADFDLLKAAFAEVGLSGDELALEFAGRLSDVRHAIAIYRTNKSKLEKPGAVLFFLRNGRWPVDGVIDHAQRRAARDLQLQQVRETIAPESEQSANTTPLTPEERQALAALGVVWK